MLLWLRVILLQCALPDRLDLHIFVPAVDARRASAGPSIDLDRLISLYPLDLKVRVA
jgi:hypothetical protein